MKKRLFFFLLFVTGAVHVGCLLAFAAPVLFPKAKPRTAGPKVMMCANGNTSVYHLQPECPALQRCSHEVLVLSSVAAQREGMRLCVVCE